MNPPYAMAFATVSGDMDAVRQAGEKLGGLARMGVVISDCPEVGRDGTPLSDTSMALRRTLDFHVLTGVAGRAILSEESGDAA